MKVPSLQNAERFFLDSDKSWILDYGSSLREKEENFDNLCCESSQPTMEYHE